VKSPQLRLCSHSQKFCLASDEEDLEPIIF